MFKELFNFKKSVDKNLDFQGVPIDTKESMELDSTEKLRETTNGFHLSVARVLNGYEFATWRDGEKPNDSDFILLSAQDFKTAQEQFEHIKRLAQTVNSSTELYSGVKNLPSLN